MVRLFGGKKKLTEGRKGHWQSVVEQLFDEFESLSALLPRLCLRLAPSTGSTRDGNSIFPFLHGPSIAIMALGCGGVGLAKQTNLALQKYYQPSWVKSLPMNPKGKASTALFVRRGEEPGHA
jgi:hypothetical protein